MYSDSLRDYNLKHRISFGTTISQLRTSVGCAIASVTVRMLPINHEFLLTAKSWNLGHLTTN